MFSNTLTITKKLAVPFVSFILLFSMMTISSCKKDNPDLASMSFEYKFHTGQTVPTAPYMGTHVANLTATLMLEELESGSTTITVTLANTVNGETYNIHAHDAADASSTPNGTPYNETPNANVFVKTATGNGGTVTVTYESTMSFSDLTTNYSGFFVIHDPLQAISTSNISSFLVVGSFARTQANSSSFMYDFNTGQIASAFAYSGTHATNLKARITVVEMTGNESNIIVSIMNTINGETYNTHAHDVADAATTPNGTPYNETPNANVFVAAIDGNGGMAIASQTASMSYSDIINNYEGFFVIHDPLQGITTTDPTTYVVLGSFAR